ncbi:hypothetical protein MMYC01_206572 [Madurella mycetomatis]|uniref:Uncharacterized protein n=1 Tax=Madurella mycetomatis TaxID=100816 RepID=A0A175VWM7_9PEZI|nr:hypothetical protein MMYC01_206572 [Madurella mycetomatis]
MVTPADVQKFRGLLQEKTDAEFSPADLFKDREYRPVNEERLLDFKDCKSVAFFLGSAVTSNFVLSAKGSGKIMVPAGVTVRVQEGYAKFETEAPTTDGSTVVGMGARAPPSSLVSRSAEPDWMVVAEDTRRLQGTTCFRDDVTVLPQDSVSSVGVNRDSGRRYSHQN